LLRDIDGGHIAAEAAIALAAREKDAPGLKDALVAGGYLPADRADAVDAELALRLMRYAIRWYAVPGQRRFSADRERPGRDGQRPDPGRPDREARVDIRDQVNQFTLPPEAVLIRRMHAMVAIVLHNLRAGADWGAIAAEYLHGEAPTTPLGQAEADYLAHRGR
jgi:hypothetical protein